MNGRHGASSRRQPATPASEGSSRVARLDVPVRGGRWSREAVEAREQAREEERRRLARELHDELGHDLFGLKMNLVWLHHRVVEAPGSDLSEAPDKLRAMMELIERSIQTVNTIVTDLRPPALDQLGLVAAIEWQTESFARRTGLRCRFTGTTDIDLDMGRATAVFRMFQEMLTNIERHAGANRVTVLLQRLGDRLVLRVRDNGRGVSQKAAGPRSFGLLGMRERALLLGGNLTIESAPHRGTMVTVAIPLANRRSGMRVSGEDAGS